MQLCRILEYATIIFGMIALLGEWSNDQRLIISGGTICLLMVAISIFLKDKTITGKEVKSKLGKLKWAVIVLLLVFTGFVAAQTITNYMATVEHTGTIGIAADLEVYLDGVQLLNASSLDWGEHMPPGEWQYWPNMTIINIGTQNATAYFLVDSITANCSFTWPGNATLLLPGEQVYADLELWIGADAPLGNFTATTTYLGIPEA